MKLRAGILNRYLSTWGGGERVTFAVANELAALGYAVDVLTDEAQVPTPEQVTEAFGPGHSGFTIRRFADEDSLRHALSEYSVFINHCAGNTYPNRSPLGLYFVMFPFQDPGEWVGSYDYFVCNSTFTRRHTHHRWGQALRTELLYPGAELHLPASLAEKERIILSVGRFNTGGHTKNQRELLDAFLQSAVRLPRGWTLHMLGRVNDGPGTSEYVAELQRLCDGAPVRLHFNASEHEKRDLLARASIYWHATGWHRNEPEAMEHFGISVVEAMGAGAVPICFGYGGPEEIIEFGKNGFLFDDARELVTYTRLLTNEAPRLRQMQAAAMERAVNFDRPSFNERFRALLSGLVA